ncbi:hypothetical protein Tco_0598711 [Tanacetum coccineum]
MHTAEDLEEPVHQEFITWDTEDQHDEGTSQLPDCFQKPTKPPTPARDWNKTLPADHRPVQPWLSTLAQKVVKLFLLITFINNDHAYLSGVQAENIQHQLQRPSWQMYSSISNGLKIWSLTECGVKCQLAITNMHSGESHIGGENNNNSMNMLLIGSARYVLLQRKITVVHKASNCRSHNSKHLGLDPARSRVSHLKGSQISNLPHDNLREVTEKNEAENPAYDKQLNTRRIMWSLEKFVSGRSYEGDFWLLQRTI